jgi:hypothetical protein
MFAESSRGKRIHNCAEALQGVCKLRLKLEPFRDSLDGQQTSACLGSTRSTGSPNITCMV